MLVGILSVLVAALCAPLVSRLLKGRAGWLLAVPPLALAGWTLVNHTAAGTAPIDLVLPWVPSLGVELALRLDGLSALFVILIGGVGGLVLVYAGGYMGDHPKLGRFYAILLTFIAAMLALVLSDNVFLLFVCWELTSITSFLLIGFKHSSAEARDSARKALLTTAAGGLALMGGLAMLPVMAMQPGLSFADLSRFSVLADHAEAIRGHALYLPALILILLGCFTKSAQVPLHYWLPAAMAGPTPVSSLLHSATMVKAGVFLLARLQQTLGGTEAWFTLLATVGAATMTIGAILAILKRDFKAVLAYTTISVLGTLVMLLGIGTDSAIKAAVVFLTAHAFYKASLFMVAGNVDHETGTRDLAILGGLGRLMPITALAAGLAALSKGGAPPAFGYIGKKLTLQTKLALDETGILLIFAAMVTNVAMVAVALSLAVRPFWTRGGKLPKRPREAPLSMLIGPIALAIAGLFVGVVPGFFDRGIGVLAASAIAGEPLEMKLKLWAGVSVEALSLIGVSLLAFVLGWLVYRWLPLTWGRTPTSRRVTRFSSPALYESGLNRLLQMAALHTRYWQHGVLRGYISITVLTAGVLILPWLARDLASGPALPHISVNTHAVLVVLLIAAGAVATLWVRSAMGAILATGATGLGLASVLMIFSGIDLAITQVMVETLTLVLLAAAVVALPRMATASARRLTLLPAIVALTGGLIATGLVLVASSVDQPAHVATEMLERSLPEGFGRNVVNVILVDFRALDTLGEITVVAAAAIAAVALIRGKSLRPVAAESAGRMPKFATMPPGRQGPSVAPFGDLSGTRPTAGGPPKEGRSLSWPPLQILARPLTAVLVGISILVLLRGHNEPGGGFIGGLIAAAGLAVFALSYGVGATRRRLAFSPEMITAAGLILAAGSGTGGLVAGQPYLTAVWWGQLLSIGKVGTPLIFDIGVYFVVVGASLMMVLHLMKAVSPKIGDGVGETW